MGKKFFKAGGQEVWNSSGELENGRVHRFPRVSGQCSGRLPTLMRPAGDAAEFFKYKRTAHRELCRMQAAGLAKTGFKRNSAGAASSAFFDLAETCRSGWNEVPVLASGSVDRAARTTGANGNEQKAGTQGEDWNPLPAIRPAKNVGLFSRALENATKLQAGVIYELVSVSGTGGIVRRASLRHAACGKEGTDRVQQDDTGSKASGLVLPEPVLSVLQVLGYPACAIRRGNRDTLGVRQGGWPIDGNSVERKEEAGLLLFPWQAGQVEIVPDAPFIGESSVFSK